MNYQNLIFTLNNKVATVQLNTPQNLNALNETMYDEILAALDECQKNKEIKAIILNGSGRAFCGGGDISEMIEGLKHNALGFEKLTIKALEISQRIKQIPKPVIAAVHGAVAGASFNIVLACDLCIAAENTKFLQAFVNIGLIPDAGGMFLLTRAVGVNKAMELAMTGRVVKADEAFNLGFVYKICPSEDLEEEAFSLAQKMANGPSAAYAKLKALTYAAQYSEFTRYMGLESNAQVELGKTADFREGITSFLEKRPAKFIGE